MSQTARHTFLLALRPYHLLPGVHPRCICVPRTKWDTYTSSTQNSAPIFQIARCATLVTINHFAFRLSAKRQYSSHHKREDYRPAVLIGHDPVPQSRIRREWQHIPRQRKFQAGVLGPILAAVFFYWWNLETVPVSGRRRFNCLSETIVEKFGNMNFKMLLEDLAAQNVKFLPEWDPRSVMVMRVMNKLIPVSGMADKRWDIFVIDAPELANAAVLPGGKVLVFSGLFKVAKNDSALAAVLGHEVAHNLARHEAERLSGNVGFNVFLVGSLFLLSWLGPVLLFTVGKPLLRYVTGMPMNRAQELEADYIGLMMMAEACYDPREALEFWTRMDAISTNEPPEILSTHPSNKNRMAKISEWLPQAMDKRAQSECAGTSHFADMLRRAFEQGYIIINS